MALWLVARPHASDYRSDKSIGMAGGTGRRAGTKKPDGPRLPVNVGGND
jgi:hypothetical protein